MAIAQAHIDREKQIAKKAGYERPHVLHKNEDLKLSMSEQAEDYAAQYKEMTGKQLNVADCKIGRVPSGYPGFKTAAIDPSVDKVLKEDVARNCGAAD
jgi:hypothetical protein